MTSSNSIILGCVAIIAAMLANPTQQAQAISLIDFESGFNDLDSVSSINTSDNQVTFSVGSSVSGGNSPAFIAETGGVETAFFPNDGAGVGNDAQIGRFILTDQSTAVIPGAGVNPALNYFIEFDTPISSLSLDLLDYGRGGTDGNAPLGSTATLTLFSDTFSTSIGSDVFTITGNTPDPNLVNLLAENSDNPFLSASLVFSNNDGGTAIDNIQFTTVPEPLTILGSVCTLIMGMTLKRKSRNTQAKL